MASIDRPDRSRVGTASTDDRLWRIAVWAGLGLWVALAAVFAVADDDISEAVVDTGSSWAHVIELYGQIPGMLAGVAGGAVLLSLLLPARDPRGWIGLIGVGLVTFHASFMLARDLTGAQSEAGPEFLLALAVSAVILAIALAVGRMLPMDWTRAAGPAAKVAVTLPFLASFLTVWAIKIPWGRWTPRDIAAAGDEALYSPWFLIQGTNGHYSFVSGHTSYSFAAIALVLLVASGRRSFRVGVTLALGWGLLAAVSRVVIGAHFPADTLFAAGLTLTWLVLLARWFGYRVPQA